MYAGYRVIIPCEGSWIDIGIRGLGTRDVTAVDQIAKVGGDISNSLRDIRSVYGGGGYGLACEPGVGTSFGLTDWRDADRVIERIGQRLRELDLSIQVGIRVASIPVPN